jgi:translation initiation factor IF-3
VDSKQLGIKPLPEALHIARQRDLDLVEVAPDANPPVCRIMDYGKFKFDEAQRAKESRRKTTNSSIKEMKYRPKIGQGDFDTKTRQVSRFLGEGHKVKITIMFRGREMSHPDLGKKILDRVAEEVVEIGKVEAAPKLDGRNMIMVLAPDKRQGARRSAPVPANGSQPEPQPQPVTQTVAEAPVAEAPVIEAPASEVPVIEIPVIEAPVIEAPVTEAPVGAGAATLEQQES